MDAPRLRADIEVLLPEAADESFLLVRDPQQCAVDVMQFGLGTLPILQLLDGQHTLDDIRAEFVREGAGFVDAEQLSLFVSVLDRSLLLDSERFRAEMARREQFLAAPVRPAAHAGAAYPDAPGAARSFLQAMLEEAEEQEAAPLTRLIAPHIDLRLGREVYAHAHRRLAASARPDVVVVLGVRHDPGARRFVACRKDFATPLGTVRHDAALLDALEERLGEDLTEGQIVHRNEHSVEFQALWLAHHWPDDPPAIVPLLIGSFHDLVERGVDPSTDPEVEAFIGALRSAIAADGRRVVVVASVDLAHMGPVYDDVEGLDAEGETRMEAADRMVLEQVEAGSAEGFFAAIASDKNARHICGVAPVYLTLRLGDGGAELLRYGQGRIHPESGSVVSFAALSFAQ